MPSPSHRSPRRLSKAHRALARDAAEAQVPDSVILGALRARARQRHRTGTKALAAALADLHLLHAEDVAELDDFRDLGREKLQLVMFACALAYAIDGEAQRFDAGNPDHKAREGDFALVDAKQASMAQFMGRTFLVVDPSHLREEAGREARRFAEMSETDRRAELLRILPHLGVPADLIDQISQRFGLRVIQGGADVG